MDEEFKETSYQSFRDTVDGYGDEKGIDLLTDPVAVEAAKRESQKEKDTDHGPKLRGKTITGIFASGTRFQNRDFRQLTRRDGRR